MKTLKVKVKLFSDANKALPSLHYGYRPHLTVEGDDELLGVEFIEWNLTQLDCFGDAVIKLLYDGVNYSKLKQNTEFYIVEGGRKTVGVGKVVE
ncbi:MAG: hypothetical protein K2M64_02770 [Clostridia bacterium]|nr:hypothetical protein [Clostridia bacterium]